jgi:hypothetical protein
MMSSATSTDPQSLQPWQFFTLAGLIGATVVVFLSEGHSPAEIILLSFVIFGAAAIGVAAWRTFSPLAGIEEATGPQVFGGRTRAALEREKTLVLRSIKDLEFDHAMGKVSDADFAEMGARLRARAAGLMRQLDAGGGYRQAIRTEIEKRVGRRLSDTASVEVTAAGGEVAKADHAEEAKPTTRLCLSCSTVNDADARFCKGCGYQMGNW